MNPVLEKYLTSTSDRVNAALKTFLPKDNSLLSRAMRYSLFAGGKRLRPVLVITGAELCGGAEKDVMPAACALEFIHTYSLIHDDLPAMDNDDLRRGMPTSHRKFGEACAILAGDALLTDAFRLMARCAARPGVDADNIVLATGLLAAAAGHGGMIGGQVKDTIEAGLWKKKSRAAAAENLREIHLGKTAALIRASLTIGAVLSGATRRQQQALDRYGRGIGLAFQVADDILDVTADKQLLGKRGSDRDNNKLTYVSLYGLEKARQIEERLINDAKKELKVFGDGGIMLSLLADYIIERQY
jgi:geranylgeranyl diphosphate synthase type II